MTVSKRRPEKSRFSQNSLNVLIILGSVAGCLLLSPMRFFGIELLGVAPNWLLIWVVSWSVHRSVFAGAIAGITLGLVQDALTGPFPTHAIGLMIVGMLTARLQRQRLMRESIVLIAFIVFGMAVIDATAIALQLSLHRLLVADSPYPELLRIWRQHQQVALGSAILSSLWTPAIYLPLHRWWKGYWVD